MAEVSNRPARTTRDLTLGVDKARQLVRDLLYRLETNRLEVRYLGDGLKTLTDLLTDLSTERPKIVQNERIARLYNVSRLIGSSLDLQTVLNQVMDAVIGLTNAERGFLMLLDKANTLTVKVARNFDQETIENTDLMISRTITNGVLQTGQAIITDNASQDPRFAGQNSIMSYSFRSIVATPLRVRGNVIGVMYVDNRFQAGVFSADDLQLLDMFGEQAAIAIDNAIQVQARENALREQIQQLKIEIDEAKKMRQVAEIVETEYFQKLSEDAKRLRERYKSPGETDEPSGGA
ncbi:MAG: GAF domain-containing protein [Anaerolineae bacterium]|nr:GAF domain-containing protein [Anaerolineae bacterium]